VLSELRSSLSFRAIGTSELSEARSKDVLVRGVLNIEFLDCRWRKGRENIWTVSKRMPNSACTTQRITDDSAPETVRVQAAKREFHPARKIRNKQLILASEWDGGWEDLIDPGLTTCKTIVIVSDFEQSVNYPLFYLNLFELILSS
jgi:hypothetical protein